MPPCQAVLVVEPSSASFILEGSSTITLLPSEHLISLFVEFSTPRSSIVQPYQDDRPVLPPYWAALMVEIGNPPLSYEGHL